MKRQYLDGLSFFVFIFAIVTGTVYIILWTSNPINIAPGFENRLFITLMITIGLIILSIIIKIFENKKYILSIEIENIILTKNQKTLEIYKNIFIQKLLFEDNEMISFHDWQSKNFNKVMKDLENNEDEKIKYRVFNLTSKLKNENN